MELFEDRVTVTSPGTNVLSCTVPTDVSPPATGFGDAVKLTGIGGVRFNVLFRVTDPDVAAITTGVTVATFVVLIVKFADFAPP